MWGVWIGATNSRWSTAGKENSGHYRIYCLYLRQSNTVRPCCGRPHPSTTWLRDVQVGQPVAPNYGCISWTGTWRTPLWSSTRDIPFHPLYKKLDMFILQWAMTEIHIITEIWKRVVDQKIRHISATTAQLVAGMEFWAWDQVFYKVENFKYLVRMMPFYKRNCPVVDWKLQR